MTIRFQKKSFFVSCILLAFCLTVVQSSGQKVTTFQAQVLANNFGIPAALFQLSDKGFFYVGSSDIASNPKYLMTLFRTDSLGKLKWAKYFGNKNRQVQNPQAIQAPDGNIMISYSVNDSAILMKTDLLGNILWIKNYGNWGFLFPQMAICNSVGGGYLLGSFGAKGLKNFGGSGNYSVFMRTDDSGKILWVHADSFLFKQSGYKLKNVNLLKIKMAHDHSGYLACGTVQVKTGPVPNTDLPGYFVIRLNLDGTVKWSHAYRIKVQPNSSIAEGKGGIYIANWINTGITSVGDSLLITKLDGKGNLIWSKTYGHLNYGNTTMIYDSIRNALVLTAYEDITNGTGLLYAGLYKCDTLGNMYKVLTYTYAFDVYNLGPSANGDNIIQIPNGFAVASVGPTLTNPGGYFIIKTDTGGNTNNCQISRYTPKSQKASPIEITHTDSLWSMNFKTYPTSLNSGSLSSIDSVYCLPFVAWFTYKDTCYGHATQFFDSTYLGAKKWHWDFGEPSSGTADTSTAKTPVHTYQKTGKYTVTLIVGNGSNTDTLQRSLTIIALPPQFHKDTTICAGDSVQLIAYGGSQCLWNHTGILSPDSVSPSVWAYPYRDTGVIARVTNAGGCTIYDTFRIKLDTSGTCHSFNKISGIINQYASVSVIDTCANALIVDTGSFFVAGAKALLIEMQGAQMDSSNTASFGTLKNINNAGNHEYVTIDSVSGNKVFLRDKPLNTYDVAGKMQLVTVPQYYHVQVSDTLRARPWNGAKGGILMFEAQGNVFMTSAIYADGQGFRGGQSDSGGTGCHKTDFVNSHTSLLGAAKGEGIANNSLSLAKGRGAPINGGGGGDGYVSGGGGGANFGTGGMGGKESGFCSGATANGGIGGNGLSAVITSGRIFPGGGGGAGFAQSSGGSSGGSGGGIVMIKASKLISYGHTIQANGADSKGGFGFQGGGGGGAGGMVVLDIPNFVMPTPILAQGGKGGDAFHTHYCMGPGGGGGGGALLLTNQPAYVQFSAKPGFYGTNTAPSSLCYRSANGADSGRAGGMVTGASPIVMGTVAIVKPEADMISVSINDSGHVQVWFNKSTDPHVNAYKIYRSTNSGAFTYIHTVSQKSVFPFSYIDTINTQTDTFSYRVFATDTCGNTSTVTETHRSMHLSAAVSGCKQAISLHWSGYKGWATLGKYDIYRAVNGGPEALLATGLFTTYTDSTLDYHDRYCYRILAHEGGGTGLSWSNQTCGQTFAPDIPKLVSVSKTSTSPTNGAVALHWQSIAKKPHLAYTEVFYSGDGKNFAQIGKVPALQDSFVQSGINTATADGFYYIKTLDSCGTVSDSSLIHKTMDLTVSVGQLLHKLNWTPYQGFKIKNYRIERWEGGKFVTVDSVPGTDTFSREFPAPCNYAIRYRIEADGYNSGEISYSDTMGRQALDTIAPVSAAPTALSINGTTATISFTGSTSPDVYQYMVQRSVGGLWGTAGTVKFTHPGDKMAYTDNITGLNPEICYTLVTLDSCLNATTTDTVCAIQLGASSLSCFRQVQLKWEGGCNGLKACADSFLIYRSTNGVDFIKIKSLIGSATSFTDTGVNLGTKYYYRITAVNNKNGYTSTSDTLSAQPRLIPQADSAQLVYATVLKTDTKTGEIYVQWDRAPLADTNARGYYVYSYDTTNKKYTLIHDETNLNTTNYIQSGLNTQYQNYKYYIITYNVCDIGVNSPFHKPVLLKVSNGNLSAQLTWSDYLGQGVKDYKIYKSKDGGPASLWKDAGTDSAAIDSNISCHHIYTYQVQALLANGKISFSDSVTVTGQDTIKPVTGSIYHVSVTRTGTNSGVMSLRWLSARDKNLKAYNIYRSEDGVSWQLVSSVPVTAIASTSSATAVTETDSGLDTYDKPYYYRIQPVDSCGNLGDMTPVHESIHLKASAGDQFAMLRWNAYQGWKVKQYSLYRNGNLIATLGRDTLQFKDTSTVCGQIYQYQIRAIADSIIDTLFSQSNTDSIRAFDHQPPQKVYIKTVTVSDPNRAATITWAPSASFDVKNYYIYRKSPNGDIHLVDSTDQTTFTDSTYLINPIDPINPIHDADCYYVFARDHCGNQSPGSNEGCIIILNAKNQGGHNDLDWNGYRTWFDGIRSYNVYKNEDNQGWNLIGTTTSGITQTYTDNNLYDSTISFCYQVEAVENTGQYNQLSRSTTVCVHQDATVFIPNTFSHYHIDGLNDYFAPKGLYIKSYTMQIYNRWGELVFSNLPGSPSLSNGALRQAQGPAIRQAQGPGWDGTFHGADALEGVYIYLISVEDYNGNISHFSGNVTVLR